MAFLKAFHAAAAECLIFLQHVQSIEFCWIPADAKPGATPSSVMQIQAPGFERQTLGNGVGVLCWRVSLLSPRVGMDWCYFFWKGTIFFSVRGPWFERKQGGKHTDVGCPLCLVVCFFEMVGFLGVFSNTSRGVHQRKLGMRVFEGSSIKVFILTKVNGCVLSKGLNEHDCVGLRVSITILTYSR